MTPDQFVAKWKGSTRTERAASQEHFIDLCRMLGVQTPNEADPTGDWYAFEKGASKTLGGDGFADVWKKGAFAWEYKGKRKDLASAYKQLLDYREALENPPLLVVCDLDRFEVRTNWTNTATKLHSFALDDLASDPGEPLRVLRATMADPDELRPRDEAMQLTANAATRFAQLAVSLSKRYDDALEIAHFLDKVLFCLYAEDAGVLPKGLFTRLIESGRNAPAGFQRRLVDLFSHMSVGGFFGVDHIDWFDGGLFAESHALDLTGAELDTLASVSRLNWALIEPAIFGTLFERGLDPAKRSQLGAHYTDRESIERLVEPVIMTPLRREFEAGRSLAESFLERGGTRNRKRALAIHQSFLARLRAVRVLDPACGSGNFLYVALRKLKDLERQAVLWASGRFDLPMELFLGVGPENVMGIELNPYAAELARVTIWIGEIQWMLSRGFSYRRDPVLRPLNQIAIRDAILDLTDPTKPQEPDWPAAEFIVGNPPFLGGKRLRRELGDDYVDALFEVYAGRVPQEADLVAYWHEKARAMVATGRTKRVGLLATQGIRGGANRRVIERIKETGDLFLAWSDEPWVLEGADVHVSLLGYDDGTESERSLDGRPVSSIHANLTAGLDVTKAHRLKENVGVAFMGTTKDGPFDLTEAQALRFLAAKNPDGRDNRDVVKPWANGLVTKGGGTKNWIIDFGVDMPESEAALYEGPYQYAFMIVRPTREENKRASYRERWWLHAEPRPAMREALRGCGRYIATVRHSKHRIFFWLPAQTLPDSALIVFARDDDYALGILHSRVHEVWALRQGSQLESRFRYTPRSCFETFPFPEPTEEQRKAVAEAATKLATIRAGGVGLVDEATPKGRTLTHLYTKMPGWLRLAHERLDEAVAAAYGWAADLTDDDIAARLLAMNVDRMPA